MSTPTSTFTIITWIAYAVAGNGDTLPAQDNRKVELDLLRQRFKTEGEGVHDDALAVFADMAKASPQLQSILASLT